MSTHAHCRKLTILVAEDDQADFLYLRCLLQNADISLLRVADGEEALNYFKGAGKFGDRSIYPLPDIFIVDLRLPTISGHDVLEWLQVQPEFNAIKRFVLAGSHLPSDRNRAELAGAEHYFMKPLGLGHLALILEKNTGGGFEPVSPGSSKKTAKGLVENRSELQEPLKPSMACCLDT